MALGWNATDEGNRPSSLKPNSEVKYWPGVLGAAFRLFAYWGKWQIPSHSSKLSSSLRNVVT